MIDRKEILIEDSSLLKENTESCMTEIHIWVAEDDEEFREVLGNFLARKDRVIQLFKNGQEVLEAMKKGSLDLLITDLMMPGADGIQILKEVKRLDPESMVIIMTGYASLDTAIQAIRGGAYDYIRKPFKLDELEIVVHNSCEKISLMRENRRLLQRLKETMEEMKNLKINWEQHRTDILDFCLMFTHDQKISEIELALNQMNPIPPDYDFKRQDFQKKMVDPLEKLIDFKKEGFIDEVEFVALKKKLLQKLED